MEGILSIANDIETPKSEVISGIKEILNKLPSSQQSENPEDRNKAIDSLSSELITEMRGHLYNVIREEDQRQKEGKSNQMEDLLKDPDRFIRGHIKGEIFEKLVMVDPLVNRIRFDNIDPENMEKIEKLSTEILSVMQDPSRYGLEDKIKLHRLPDATYINIKDDGFVEILGVGEAKSGVIDNRFLSQAANYYESIEIIAKELSKIRHPKRLRNLGLYNLADRMESSDKAGSGNFVRVSKNFTKTLIVPQDKYIGDDKVYDSVDDVINSSFTSFEIEAITDFVFDEISKVDENLKRVNRRKNDA